VRAKDTGPRCESRKKGSSLVGGLPPKVSVVNSRAEDRRNTRGKKDQSLLLSLVARRERNYHFGMNSPDLLSAVITRALRPTRARKRHRSSLRESRKKGSSLVGGLPPKVSVVNSRAEDRRNAGKRTCMSLSLGEKRKELPFWDELRNLLSAVITRVFFCGQPGARKTGQS
jgi:hypothetical protein